jgi:glycosyltransferase involved in cell wall biosynthesis
MRVIFIGPFGLRVKGTMSRRAMPMAMALAARGHQVDVILPPWDCPEDSGREWEEEGVGVYNIALPPRFPPLFHLLVTWRLVRRTLSLKPDVVHCFKPKAYAGLSATAIWFLQKLGVTRARLVVDSDDWEGWGGWNEIGDYTWAQKRFFAWQERWGLTHCDAVTVASRTLQTLAWSLGVAPKQVFYVPNGANLKSPFSILHPPSSILHSPSSILQPPFSVLLYTRFFEFQAERVIEVFERVAAEVPEVKFLIVGKGLSGEEDKLLHLVTQRELAGKIVYTGWVELAQLADCLAAADVAIYPLDDNLLNRARCSAKLVDLMAAGLAIVAEDVGQSSEYIEHGCSGLLVEAGDTEAFARCVVRLLRDKSLRGALGNEARRRVCEEFTWERLVERIESAYHRRGEVNE